MTGLEQTFYIMAVVYMAITFAFLIAVVVALFAIKAKLHAIQQNIEHKLAPFIELVQAGRQAAAAVKKVVTSRR
jgi:hypothetical protein